MPRPPKPRYVSLTTYQWEEIAEHIKVHNGELGSVKENLAKITTDLDWLKRSYWAVVGATITNLVALFFSMMK